ncbi:hypothetical protein GF359_04965 [candidate division WOR-3 bacterium]|uniref:Uncharacterized protein n=1 Tax=candidate division WOR-3 bacterium TaxID=2052148 RepID=A0A9D5K8Y4_UNCW3|nr:hypothetical protein [candidate division WOR-3 bacterium]MBD3364546.1 hypothetical protein [candidate division WOR-3 bacterium]
MMIKVTLTSVFIAGFLCLSCSPKLIKTSVYSDKRFNYQKAYKIAILTPYVSGMTNINYAYRMGNYAVERIMEAQRLIPADKKIMRQIERPKGTPFERPVWWPPDIQKQVDVPEFVEKMSHGICFSCRLQ